MNKILCILISLAVCSSVVLAEEEEVVPNVLGILDTVKMPASSLVHLQAKDVLAVQCNTDQLTHCLQVYYTSLGFPKGFQSAQAYLAALQKMVIQQRQKGLMKICSADQLLTQCLGPAQYASCLSVPSLIQYGATLEDAYIYVQVVNQFHFECGAGYLILLSNLPCAINVTVRQNSSLVQCQLTWSAQLQSNPSQACMWNMQFSQCYKNIFNQYCGSAVGWFSCENIRVGLLTEWPYCNYACTVGSSSMTNNDDGGTKSMDAPPAQTDHLQMNPMERGNLLQQSISGYAQEKYSYLADIAQQAAIDEAQKAEQKKQ